MKYPRRDIAFLRSVENEKTELTNERLLWATVIFQALKDACSEGPTCKWYRRAEAQTWLTQSSPDLRWVCTLADVDCDYLLVKMNDLAKRDWDHPIREEEAKRGRRGKK
jgi:hypothetical protein